MDDFSKYLSKNKHSEAKPVPNEYGGIYDKPKAPAHQKVGFIRARLNRDNFWNLIFWLGMSCGCAIAALIGEKHNKLASVVLWITILGMPILLRIFNRVTFIKDNEFLNSEGQDLSKRLPSGFTMVITALAVPALIGLHLDTSTYKHSLIADIIGYFSLFLGITLYFILINCPMAILFNKDIWYDKNAHKRTSCRSSYSHHKPHHSDHISSLSPRSWTTSPGHSSLSSNIHHRR
jgi:hypothetical protein